MSNIEIVLTSEFRPFVKKSYGDKETYSGTTIVNVLCRSTTNRFYNKLIERSEYEIDAVFTILGVDEMLECVYWFKGDYSSVSPFTFSSSVNELNIERNILTWI